jgi:hypothetical protein
VSNSTVQSVSVGRRSSEAVLEIDVRGSRPHIGKSYVSELIRRTLAEHGIKANVVSGDNDQALFQNQTDEEFKANFAGMVGKLSPITTILDNNAFPKGNK